MVKLTDSKVIFYPYIYPKSINGMLMFCPSLYFFPKNRLYLDLIKLFLYNYIVQMYFDGQFYKRLTNRGSAAKASLRKLSAQQYYLLCPYAE